MDADLRAAVIRRDQGKCVRCGQPCEHQRHSVHHRKYKSRGGRDEFPNLILLCGSGGDTNHCHGLVHDSSATGYTLRSWENPATVPVHIHQLGNRLLTPDGGYAELGAAGRDVGPARRIL